MTYQYCYNMMMVQSLGAMFLFALYADWKRWKTWKVLVGVWFTSFAYLSIFSPLGILMGVLPYWVND